MIDDPRELWRGPNSKFQAELGITEDLGISNEVLQFPLKAALFLKS